MTNDKLKQEVQDLFKQYIEVEELIDQLKKDAEGEIDWEPRSSNLDDCIAQGARNGEIYTAKAALIIINKLTNKDEK